MGRNTFWLTASVTAALALASPASAADKATALLKDSDGIQVGEVTLTAVPSGVLMMVDLLEVPPGTHGFHIHETGKCEPPDFKSAGGHFNPDEDEHGFLNPAGPHAGDMPNIHVPENGKLKIEILNQRTQLSDGLLDDDGSAIVIHKGADDYKSDPAGHAGDRLACGVITAE